MYEADSNKTKNSTKEDNNNNNNNNNNNSVKILLVKKESKTMAVFDAVTVSPLVKSFLAGSFSGTCSTVLFQPLDLVKTRIQTAITLPTSGGNNGGSGGMLATVGRVVRNERLFGLWKGMTPSILRCVPGVGLYFSSLSWLRTTFCDGQAGGPLQALSLGVAARTLTGVTLIPITVIKTRYESGVYAYTSMRGALYSIYMKEGPRGLTRGLLPTLLRDAPFSGLYLMFYTQTKKHIPLRYMDTSMCPALHFTSGVVAGLLASAVTQPFDVVKTKMQLYPHKFTSFQQACIYVHTKYGPRGYFKGLVPRMLRRTLMAAMAWTVYEQITKTVGLK